MNEEATTAETASEEAPERKWEKLGRDERRVVGVLVEKAKTTPDAYPLTLNALTNGCNQKSNRFPQLDLEPIHVQRAMEKLKPIGAVTELISGRVEKYRHHMSDWLGVNGVELAIMAELLLRGAQSIGDLRGRANRMSPIGSVAELKPIVKSLMQRELIVPLTEPGRGQIVTHNLYANQEELDDLRREFNGGQVVPVDMSPVAASSVVAASVPAATPSPVVQGATANPSPVPDTSMSSADGSSSAPSGGQGSDLQALQAEVESLKAEVARLRSEVEDLWSNVT